MTMPSSFRKKDNSLKDVEFPSYFNKPQGFESESLDLPSSFRPKKQERNFSEDEFMSDEEFESNIQRAQGRSLSRIGETVLGAPGDIASFISSLFGKEQNILPTSGQLKNVSEKITRGYTKPETEFEKGFDEFTSDVATFALPGSGHYSLARNIGIPIVGNLVKQGLKYGNSDEKTQAYSKLGTMVALDLISRRSGGIKKYINNLWNDAEASVPKGVSIDAKSLEKSLDNLEKSLTAGGKKPSTSKSLEKILEIKGEIKNGKIPLQRLVPFRKSINEVIDEMGGFSHEVPFRYRPQAKYNLNQVKSKVIDSVNEYADKFNPELAKKWRDANEAWAAYSQSNKVANFLQKKLPFIPKSQAVQTLFSYSPTVGIAAVSKMSLPIAGATAASAGAYQGYKILDRVVRSPLLRKYYAGVVKNASAGNVPQTSKNLKALDNYFEKEE